MTLSFPVALKLDGRLCLVVGDGAETLGRLEALAEAGARLHLVTRNPRSELVERAHELGGVVSQREYRATDLEGVWLAVLCEQDAELATRIGADAEARQVFFCGVDQPAYSSFSHVGITRSGPLFIAIGTEGKAPALARRLKHELARALANPALNEFVGMLVKLRDSTPRGERAALLTREASRLRLDGGFVVDAPDS
ncbi:MAG TPA: NAD(P)-dependent oxidoreductase [Polyangiaceae bacterium]